MNSNNSPLAATAGLAASVSPPVVSIKLTGESLSNIINNNLNIKAKTDEDAQANSVEIPNNLDKIEKEPQEEVTIKHELNDAENIETDKTETDRNALIPADSINHSDDIPVTKEISSEIIKITKEVDVIDTFKSDASAPNSNDKGANIDVPSLTDKNASHKITSLKDNDNQVNSSNESITHDAESVENEIKNNTQTNGNKYELVATSSNQTNESNPEEENSKAKDAINHTVKDEENTDKNAVIPNELLEKPEDTGEDDDDKGDDTLYIDEGNDQNENKQDSDVEVKRHKDILDTDTEEEVEEEEDEDEKAFGVNIKDKKKKIKEAMGSKPVEKIDVEMFKSEWSDEDDNDEDVEKDKLVNQSDASKDNKKTTTNEKTPSTNNTKNTPSKDLETDIIDQYDNNDTAQDEASTDKVDSENVHEDIDLEENGEDLEGIDDDKDIEEDDHTHDEPMDTTEDNREQVADVPITLTEDTSTLQDEHTELTATNVDSAPLDTSDNTEKTDSSLLDESLEENMLIEEISQDGEMDVTEVVKETDAGMIESTEVVNIKEMGDTEGETEVTEVNLKATEMNTEGTEVDTESAELDTEVTEADTEATEVMNVKEIAEEDQLLTEDGVEESFVVIEAANGDNLADFVIVNENNEEQEIYEEIAEDGTKTYYVKVKSTAIGQEDGVALAEDGGTDIETLKAAIDDEPSESGEVQDGESQDRIILGPQPLAQKKRNALNLYMRKDQLSESGENQDESPTRRMRGPPPLIHKKGRRGLNLYLRKGDISPDQVGRLIALQQLESPELRRRNRNPPLPPSGVTLDQAQGPKVQIKISNPSVPQNKAFLEKVSNLSKAKLERTVQLRNAEKARAFKRQTPMGARVQAVVQPTESAVDSAPSVKTSPSSKGGRPAAKTPLKNVNKPFGQTVTQPTTVVEPVVKSLPKISPPLKSQTTQSQSTPAKNPTPKKAPRVSGTPSSEERTVAAAGGDATPSRKSTRLKIENQTLKDYAVDMPESYATSYTQSATIVITKTPGGPGRPSKRKLAELKDYEGLGTPDTAATKRFMISYANTRRRPPPYSMGGEEEGAEDGSNPVIPPLIIENGKDIVDRLLSGEQRSKRRGRGAPSGVPEDLIIVESSKKKKLREFDASLIPSASEIEENHRQVVLGTEDLLNETSELLSTDDTLPASTTEPNTPAAVEPTPSPKPSPSIKPNQPSVKPNQPSVKPNQPSVKPNQTSVKPNQPSVKPNQLSVKPDPPSSKPSQAAGKRLARGLKAAARVAKASSPAAGGSSIIREVVKSIKAAKIPANTWNVETREEEEEEEEEEGEDEAGSEEEAEEASETVLLDGDKKRQNKMMREINMLLGDEGAINMLYSMTQKRNRSESVESANSTSATSKSKRKSLQMRTRLVKSAVMNLSSSSEVGVQRPPAPRLRKSAFKSNNLPSIPKPPPRKVSVDSIRSSLSESAASKSPRPASLTHAESVIFRRHSSDSSCSDEEEAATSEGGATPSRKATTPLRSPQTPGDASRHLKSMIRSNLTSLTNKRRSVKSPAGQSPKTPSTNTLKTPSNTLKTPSTSTEATATKTDVLAEEKRTSKSTTSAATVSSVAGESETKKSTLAPPVAESGTKKTTSAILAADSGTKRTTSATLAADSGTKKKAVKRSAGVALEKGAGEGNVSVIEEVEQELETLFGGDGGDTATETVETSGDVPETKPESPTPVPQPVAAPTTSKPAKKKSRRAPQADPVAPPLADASEQATAQAEPQADADAGQVNAGGQADADEVNVISVKICDDLAYISFLNQNKQNFFTVNVLHELTATLVYLDRQDACKTILMMGCGFSSGVDLAYLLCDNRHKRRRNATSMANALKEFITTLSQLGKPILLGVRGQVVGAAVTVLPLFDFVLAAEGATFETLYPRLGQIPEAAATFTFPTFLGRNATSELLLNCKKISSSEAKSLNLVTRVCDDEAFEKTAELWAKEISKYSAQSMQTTKLLLRKDQYSQLNETLSTETDFLIEHWNSEEVQKNLKKHLSTLH